MDPITELRLASESLVGHAAELGRRALAAWGARWGATGWEPQLAVAPWEGQALPGAGGRWYGAADASSPALFWPDDATDVLATLLFGGTGPSGSLASEGADHVSATLRDLLLTAWGGAASSPERSAPEAMSRWDAPLHITIGLGHGRELTAIVPAARCRLGTTPAQASLAKLPAAGIAAFHSLPASATLVIGAADVSVPEAAALQVGDVIVLNTCIHDLLELRLPAGEAAIPVHLGHADGLRAVEVASGRLSGS